MKLKRNSGSRLVRNETATEPKKTTGIIQNLTCNLLPKLVRNDTMEGRNFLVVPMVILTEGVHNGSEGPLYYPPAEMSKTPAAWNHKPVVVYHPEINGQGVSACDPTILTNRKVGLIMNTKYEKGRLKAEAWLEQDRANLVDERIMAAITSNEMMEVSTGVFVDRDETPGEWNGESYVGLARNYRPDHLAILPDKIGACSIADGAGLLRNEGKSKGLFQATMRKVLQKMGFVDNELSHSNIREAIATLLRKKLNVSMESGPYAWVEDVYDEFFIYEFGGKLYRLGYTANDLDVTLSTDAPVEVERVTEYRTVAGAFVGNQKQKTKDPTEGQESMDKKKLVDNLIANSGGALVEADRDRLMAFSEDQLKRIHVVKNEPAPATPPPAAAPAANAAAPAASPAPAAAPAAASAPVTAPAAAKPVTLKEYVDNAPPEMRDVLNNSLTLHNEEKAKLVEAIYAVNKENGFSKEDLSNRPLGELRNLARLAGVAQAASQRNANYGGMANVPTDNTSTAEEAMALPTMNFEKATK